MERFISSRQDAAEQNAATILERAKREAATLTAEAEAKRKQAESDAEVTEPALQR